MEEDLEVPFPWPIIQRKIEGYVIHADGHYLELSGEHSPSYACRRVEFDNYLYLQVKALGIEVVPARVTDLDFLPDGVMVYSENRNLKADIVVGAFGLDDGISKVFERLTPYRMPEFLSSVVTKIHPGEGAMREFGNFIHAFLPQALPLVEFGAITPKGNHLSINIAGRKVDAETMDQFLSLTEVRTALPGALRQSLPMLAYFKGKFPTLPARASVGERYIMIGDSAGLNRPFKGKGINSAIFTGIKAARTILEKGISREALENYLRDCCELTDDVNYGRFLRTLIIRFSRYGMIGPALEIAKKEPALRQAMFNIVSGEVTYKKTWQETRNIRLLTRLFFATLSGRLKRPRLKDD